MMRLALTVACLLLLTSSAVWAEPTPFAWRDHRRVAERLSDVAVVSAIGLESWQSWRAPDRGHAFGCQALRLGLSVGVATAVKGLVHRTRPDGSNRHSFYSGHTANAMVSSGWRYAVGIPLALGAGYFRMAAHKHYMTDVATGAAAGLALSRICR